MFTLQRTRIQNMQFAVYISDTTVILKQSQGHQTYNDNVGPEQGYNHAKFQGPPLDTVCQKSNIIVFVKSENMLVISLKYTGLQR